MTREQQNKRFDQLLTNMSQTRMVKNADYATNEDSLSNLRECEQMGIPAWQGAIIRMGDKWSRLKQLTKNGYASVKGENIYDTLLDLAIYCLLTIILLEEKQELVDMRKMPRFKELKKSDIEANAEVKLGIIKKAPNSEFREISIQKYD